MNLSSLGAVSVLTLATLTPAAFAGNNDYGLITTKGEVHATCSVDDLHIPLSQDGNKKLTGKGDLAMSQTGRTKWSIGTTDHQHGGTNYSNHLTLDGPKGLKMTSTDKSGTSNKYIDGAFDGDATVEVTLTAKGAQFSPGTYGTQTTVMCVVQ